MRHARIIALLLVGFGLTPSARAGEKPQPAEWVSLGGANLKAEGVLELEIPVGETGIAGFEVVFDYFEPVMDDSWASDLQVAVIAPTRDSYIVGGQTTLPLADACWSFQGKISDGAGHYGDRGDDIFLPWVDSLQTGGFWTLRFKNDWATDPNGNDYYNIHVRFYTVPEPTCPQDIDGDGDVGFGDILQVLANWGPCGECPEDIDGDGESGFGDILMILAHWGSCR